MWKLWPCLKHLFLSGFPHPDYLLLEANSNSKKSVPFRTQHKRFLYWTFSTSQLWVINCFDLLQCRAQNQRYQAKLPTSSPLHEMGRHLRSKFGVSLLFLANYFSWVSAEIVQIKQPKKNFGFLGGVQTCCECTLTTSNARALTSFNLKEVTQKTSVPPLQVSAASSRHDVHFRFHLCCRFNLDTDLRHGRTQWCELLAERNKIQTSKSKTEN